MAERQPLMGGSASGQAVATRRAMGGGGVDDSARGLRLLQDNLSQMPTSVAGLALGVCGLGITWQTAAAYLLAAPATRDCADMISLVAFNVGVTLLLLYGVKMMVAAPASLADAKSLDGSTDLSCLSMALMMIAWWLHVHGLSGLGWALWQTAVAAHCVLLAAFLRHVFPFAWANVTPGWLTPFTGLAMAAGTGSALGAGAWVDWCFWAAFVGVVGVYPAVLYRVHAHPAFLSDHHQVLQSVRSLS